MMQVTYKISVPVAVFSLTVSLCFAGSSEALSQSRDQSRQSLMESSSPLQQKSELRWLQVTGEVEETKNVAGRGFKEEHLVVLLVTDTDRRASFDTEGRTIVDLGPARQWRDLEIRKGDRLIARGPIGRVGNRPIILAKQVQTNGQLLKIQRESSEQQSEQQADDYPYAHDNRAYNADDACRNVSRGMMGGTLDWQWKSDAELRLAVECRLSNSPFIKGESITVSVDDGTATLSGMVQDKDSIRSAIVDVYGAGVKDVVSKLEVVEE
ncbi:MAG: BON domain-containing protein [Nitrospira sp.]|nr:BON domain-containing protein [Nitrospira sp.]